jgi:hypothetical protein
MPEVKNFNEAPNVVNPIVDVQWRMKDTSNSGIAAHRGAHVRKAL